MQLVCLFLLDFWNFYVIFSFVLLRLTYVCLAVGI